MQGSSFTEGRGNGCWVRGAGGSEVWEVGRHWISGPYDGDVVK